MKWHFSLKWDENGQLRQSKGPPSTVLFTAQFSSKEDGKYTFVFLSLPINHKELMCSTGKVHNHRQLVFTTSEVWSLWHFYFREIKTSLVTYYLIMLYRNMVSVLGNTMDFLWPYGTSIKNIKLYLIDDLMWLV